MPDIEAEIAAMREAVRAKSDAELAELLGVGRSAVSQWRKRGAVPERAKRQADEVRSHLDHYASARAKVAALPVEVQTAAIALAIAYVYRHASGEGRRLDDRLFQLSGAFDQIVLAAALLIREERLPAEVALSVLLGGKQLERNMTDALLPPLRSRKLPQ